jgi:hypothetical protein
MDIQWKTDVDNALTQAKNESRPLLLDFTAAPM